MDLAAIPDALAGPFLDPASRTWWGGLVAFGLVALVLGATQRRWTWRQLARAARHPSSLLDVQLLAARQLLRVLTGAPSLAAAWWLATHGVRWLDRTVGRPELSLPEPLVVVLYSVVLFVAWDLSRFLVHLAMHRIPALWAFHQVHHSAEVLTPLTFHRIHPVESWLYQLRGTVVTAAVVTLFFWLFREQASTWELLGVPALGLVLNVLMGNLRHSHVWLPFPEPVERWLISPAQHQLHHSAQPEHFDSNYGTWLALWDRLAGSWQPAREEPVIFGLGEGARNHGHDLWSAWTGPVLAVLPRRAGVAPTGLLSLVGLLLAGGLARAEEPAPASGEGEEAAGEGDGESDEDTDRYEAREAMGIEIMVYDEDGVPRVAGSAHAIDESTLSQFEYDDIERVLSEVPGVSTRGEDGYGLRPNIGIRGANSDRSAKITLMEDGVLLAPAPYAAPAAYYFPMATRMVGVEVFKGPAATRHGPHTVGGALNLQTRAVPRGQAAYLDLAGGLYRTGKVHGWAATGDRDAGVLVEGVHLGSGGFKALDTGGPTGFDRTELMAKARWRPAAGHELGLKLGYAREHSHETYLGLTLADYEADPYRRYAASELGDMRWSRTQAEASWQARLSQRVRLRTVAYHHLLDRQWLKLNRFRGGPELHQLLQQAPDTGQGAVFLSILRGEEDSSTAEQQLMIGTNDRRFHAGGLQSLLRWEIPGEAVGNELEAGLRLHVDDVSRLHTEDPHDMVSGRLVPTGDPRETLLDSRAGAQALAAHVHDDLRLGSTHVIPGARLEVVRTWEEVEDAEASEPQTRAILLPGLGLLQPLHDSVDAFVGAYRGFSPVGPGQPEEVEPEQSWNLEGGLRASHVDLEAEVVGFVNAYTNITGQCTISGGCTGDQLDQQFNGGAARVWGLESTVGNVFLLPGMFSLPVSATWTWTEAEFLTGFTSGFPQFGTVEQGDFLPYVARHQGHARVTLMSPAFDLGGGLTARSGMLDEAGLFPVTETDVPPLVLLDAALNVRPRPWLTVYATGSNLLGSTAITSWRPFGARPTAPTQVMVGLKVERGPAGS